VPRRIECFDISTIQGAETVASMVVCEDGRMKRTEYRKYRIRGSALGARRSTVGGRRAGVQPLSRSLADTDTVESPPTAMHAGAGVEVNSPAPAAAASGESSSGAAQRRAPSADSRFLDDFASMHEVVLRRYRKLLETGGAFPDLLLIDGGKGQLSAAYEALEELGLGSLVAVGIAKKEELLFTRDREDPIGLATESPALLLIQRIRDEAHRFAVTFHRQQRKTRDLRSELDEIGGIGPRRRKALLTAFGSVAGVRRAAREELARVIGVKGADAVLAHFGSRT